jgi:hypothetical protein
MERKMLRGIRQRAEALEARLGEPMDGKVLSGV